ncbi:MAG: DUF11 domain-containing protein [Polyangiaceae bacterium]|nr:DUF11 domain-containing protein [Polyangiaceae bacterium]
MRRTLGITGLAGLGLLGVLGGRADAAPTLRYQIDQHGDFVMIGNTLGYDCGNGTPAPIVGAVGACGGSTGDTAPDIYWRADSPAAGQAQANTGVAMADSRSTAVLTLPPGATVTRAYLYWGARVDSLMTDPTAVLERPGAGGFTANLTADDSYTATNNNNFYYQSVVNVTALVQANGPGAYRLSGVTSSDFVGSGASTNFAGWWMVVLYERPADPLKNLAIFDGLDPVDNGAPQNVTLDGFLVPASGYTAKLGVATYEGDGSIQGDQLQFGPLPVLSDAANPANNFFNGTRSALGAPVSVAGDLPQLSGGQNSMSGIDLDVVDVTAKVSPGQTSVPITASSTQDVYLLAGWVTSISTYKPDYSTSTKSAVDLNGGGLLPGDVLQYTIVATNTGNDTSVNTVLTDVLPPQVTYVPGSIQIVSGANPGLKSDQPNDDQAEFGNGTVTVRLGSGANAAQGGQMAVGESSTVMFLVTVNAGASGTISNQATISAAGLLGAPAEDDITDGNGPAGGSPPTDVVIDQCATDAQCAAPTPHCDTAPAPNVCVECVIDAHCSGTTPTCDVATRTCVCAPTGLEVCDGNDNDCNGTVDEGFNTGAACTSGLGACQAAGVLVCNGPASTACDAVPGQPSPEICDDGIDQDCDGAPDDGCADSDGDGIVDVIELLIGTDPSDADTDDDGVPDGAEPSYDEDTDGDGLINALDPDSDNDGLYDGTELGLGCNGPGTDAGGGHCIPDGDAGATTTDPLDPDTDDGGVGDGNEDTDLDGAIDAGETDPTAGHGADDAPVIVDSDGDGLSDELEGTLGSDPNDADTDDDGVIDGQELNPADDTDGDGLINVLDVDSDNDGLYDGTELGLDCIGPGTDAGAGHCVADADGGATVTNPLDPDTDDGSVPDGQEDTDLDGAVDPGETNPTAGHGDDDIVPADSDGDGLGDDLEILIGTDPGDADSDDDGVIDGDEPNFSDDHDGDGLINALDPDSDGDFLLDGTELGLDCGNPATDPAAGNCTPDGDGGATTTNPLDPDTDDGGIPDGIEDADRDGAIDAGELDPNDPADDVGVDTDGDGIPDVIEAQIGTDPGDADSDDDGVIDGAEPSFDEDTDGDGDINALDPDSDGDGLFDGTELGLDCGGAATDPAAGNCIPDGDDGATVTDPLDPDTDHGGIPDGTEDGDHDGVVDGGEGDPNDPTDDGCQDDSDCGDVTSGQVCDDATHTCVDGCRGEGGNGCPDGEICTSIDATIGVCVPPTDECTTDADCGGPASGRICDVASGTCVDGCRGTGGNTCPEGQVCSSTDGSAGTCAEPDRIVAEGNGLLCSAQPARRSPDHAAWLAGLAAAAALAIRRRRKSGR